MTTYTYEPLPHPASDEQEISIRLIHLLPGEKTGTVSCVVSAHQLSGCPDYEAVSYVWGSPSDKASIVCDGKTLLIPRNLNDFLLRTRAKGRKRTLWIDSICINQEDASEKSSQVTAMSQIYRNASGVLVWLGVEGGNSTLGLETALELSAKFKEMSQQKPKEVARTPWLFKRIYEEIYRVFDPKWAAFFGLFDRPYWTRAWVIQEIAVSKNQYVICGDKAIRWRDLVLASHCCFALNTWLFEFYGSQNLNSLMTLQISEFEVSNNMHPVHYQVLLRHRMSVASDARDRIFAYYGISANKSLNAHGIRPNYESNTKELYLKVAVSTLKAAEDLEFLDVPRATTSLDGLPSWAPFWELPFCDVSFSLLQLETHRKVTHNTTKGSKYRPVIDDEANHLELSSHVIDRITRVTNAWEIQDASGYSSLLRQARILQKNQRFVDEFVSVFGLYSKEPYPTGETRDEVAWQTCVAGVFSPSKDETRLKWRNFQKRQRLLRWITILHLQNFIVVWLLVVIVGHVLRGLGIPNPELPFRTLTSKLINRRAATTINGYVGLVPHLAQVGDHIVLAKGAQLPLILRSKGKHWEFIGDSYIHGVTQGELWDEVQSKCEKMVIV